MPKYRVYFVDRTKHFSRPPEIVECDDDQEAIQKAKQLLDGLDVELWDGPRMVVRFASQ